MLFGTVDHALKGQGGKCMWCLQKGVQSLYGCAFVSLYVTVNVCVCACAGLCSGVVMGVMDDSREIP